MLGVVLVTYGEPAKNSFVEQWVYSYRILKRLTRRIASIPKPLVPVIATARARSRVRLWNQHAFSSPLESLHEKTVSALRDELARRGCTEQFIVTKAYEFRQPGLTEVLGDLETRGCNKALIVPMYIAGGDFTDGMTRISVADAQAKLPRWTSDRIEFCLLSDTPEDARNTAEMLAEHCLESLRERSVTTDIKDWAVLLAAHGTVINPPPGADNGLVQFGRVLKPLRDLLKPHFGLVRIGWLNHSRGGKWSTPPVHDALRLIHERGYRKLVYFPWGFTTDNAETILEGRMAIANFGNGFERVEHLPCLNANPRFVALLADRICRYQPGAACAAAKLR